MLWNLVHRWKSQRYPLVHLLMLAVLALYTLLGAICFCAFEAGPERAKLARWAEENRQWKQMARSRLLSDVQFFLFREVNVSRLLSPDFQRSLDLYDSVMDFSKARPEGKRTRGAGGLEPKWTLWGGLYFAGTIYTTIGYGDIVAETVGGKCFTMLYALLGIPLVITVLNVWGGGLFQLVQMLWRNHFLPLMRSLPALQGGGEKRVRPADLKQQQQMRQLENGQPLAKYSVVSWHSGRGGGAGQAGGPGSSLSSGCASNSGGGHRPPKLPLKLAFVLLLAWVLLCAALFAIFQRWTFFDAAYFFFISLTTIGLGDYTAEHKVACAYFLLILIGLSVVSMSLNIIHLQIDGVFGKIIRSIDADFKSNLIAEKRKISISTSIGLQSLQSQHSTIHPPMQQPVKRIPLQKKATDEDEDSSDALRKYRGSMTRSERMLAQLLMSQQQRRLLNEKLGARRRMKNGATQTDDRAVDAQVQTEQLTSLKPFASLFAHAKSVDVEAEEDEEEEEEQPRGGFHHQQRRANTFSGGGRPVDNNSSRKQPPPFRQGLGKKRLYIYNTGD